MEMKFMIPDVSGMTISAVQSFVKSNLRECIHYKAALLPVLAQDRRSSVNDLCNFILSCEEKFNREYDRVKAMYDFDRRFGQFIAGVDEVGRGPLAGPIVAAAVILQADADNADLILHLNDSKKLSRKKREELAPIIKAKALSWAIGEHSSQDIDELGIAVCNNDVFIRAIDCLKIRPSFILSDGYPLKGSVIHGRGIIQGDAKSASIAAASIIAKVHRDDLMRRMDDLYPGYGFAMNVGYGSKEHIDALKQLGPCPIHRKSFIRNIMA